MTLALTTLHDLVDHVSDKFPTINWGGCGVFAAALGKRLEQRGVKCSVVVYSHGPADIDYTRSNYVRDVGNADEWNIGDLELSHVMLCVQVKRRKYYVDGTTVSEPRTTWLHYKRAKGRMTVDEIEQLARRADNWNSSFPRWMIEELENTIDEYVPALSSIKSLSTLDQLDEIDF